MLQETAELCPAGRAGDAPGIFHRALIRNKRRNRQRLAWLLAAALLAAAAPAAYGAGPTEEWPEAPSAEPAAAASDEAAEDSAGSDRLTMSILGDSNSAYHGWSDGDAADTTNSTIRDSNTYFEESDIAVEDMWWYLAAQELGAEILVNNSWSGSCVFGPNEPYAGEGTDGCGDRCVNLHDDTGDNAGEEPDIIVIFLGTDDCTFRWETIGTASAVNHAALITETEDGVRYAEPTTSAEAYAIMLDRIMRRYPDAEVYCMTVPPRRDANIYQRYVVETMNDIIRTEAARFGAVVADIYEDSGITSEVSSFDRYMMDLLHPNEEGMARIADVLVAAVRGVDPPPPEPPEDDAVPAEEAVSILLQAAELF